MIISWVTLPRAAGSHDEWSSPCSVVAMATLGAVVIGANILIWSEEPRPEGETTDRGSREKGRAIVDLVRLAAMKSVISGFRLGHFGRRGGEEMMFWRR
jgi:hypothetical protein